MWTQQAYLKPAAFGVTQAGDSFGFSVAVSGDTVVIGAVTEDSSTTGVNSTPDESAGASGAAYVFAGLGPVADLAITKTDGVATAVAGGSVTYTITATNEGPDPVTGGTVADTFPATLTCTWTCVGAGGGTCTAAGSGNINDTVNLPSGGSVTYTATGTVVGNVPGTLSNTATITAPGGVTDPNPGNNSATDTDTIVCPTVTLSPATLPNATINTAYPQTVTALPAGTAYSFAVTSGLLPTGLTLNSNGSFSGALRRAARSTSASRRRASAVVQASATTCWWSVVRASASRRPACQAGPSARHTTKRSTLRPLARTILRSAAAPCRRD